MLGIGPAGQFQFLGFFGVLAVGAGGVGFTLSKYMALFQYDLLLGALIFIVLMVTVVDRFSDMARRRFI